MNIHVKRFLDASLIKSGGGNPLPPSLADFDNDDPTPAPPAPPVEGLNEDGTLKEGYIKQADGKVVKDPNHKQTPADPVEGLNEDGTLQEGYMKDAAGNVVKDPNYKPADDPENGDEGEEDEDPASFWEDVDKLHGEGVEIKWDEIKDEQGNPVDPVSPQGAYIREKALMDKAVEKFEQYLRTVNPRGYAYMLHIQDGGTDEEFFNTKTISLPSYEDFKANADLQTKFYKTALVKKGIDESIAEAVVEKAVKEGKLFDLADKEYQEAQKAEEKMLAEIERKNQLKEQQYQTTINSFSQQLNTLINEGKGLKIAIPDTEKAAFNQFVREHVEYDEQTGKLLLINPVGTQEDLARQLEAMYLLHKKGDLSALIQRTAQTQNVKRLRKTLDKSKHQKTAGSDTPDGNKDFVPLGDL